MGRRVLAFFLGMIFGIIFLIGGLALGVYIALATVTPEKISADSKTYLGDLASMSILDITKSVQNLYLEKAGIADENGHYYSVKEFCATYNIDTTSFGVEIPEELLDIPMFEFLTADGMTRVKNQVKVSSIPAIMNMFANEEGKIDQSVLDELSKYTLTDLLDDTKGIPFVFENVKMSDILPTSFPAQDTDNKIMWAAGQASIGKTMGALKGSDNLLLQVKTGGAFEALGTIPLSDLLGSEEGMISNIMGDAAFADLVNDNGDLDIDSIVNQMYLGSVLGFIRRDVDKAEYEPAISVSENNALYRKSTGNEEYIYALWDGENCFEAELSCKDDSDSHTHTIACYGYVWYNALGVSPSHSNCNKNNELILDDGHHIKNSGIYKALVDLRMEDLLNGSSDSIVNKVRDLTLEEIVNGQISGIMTNLKDMTVNELLNGGIDALYLGIFFDYDRVLVDGRPTDFITINNGEYKEYYGNINGKTVMSEDGKKWYEASLTCKETHTHTRRCYSYKWMDGNTVVEDLTGKFADLRVSELGSINTVIQSLTIADVLGEENITGIFVELADVPLKDISSKTQDLYLGYAMNYFRKETEVFGTTVSGTRYVRKDGDKIIKSDDGEKWFEATLDCSKEHTHTDSCYTYIWYKNSSCTNKVTGMQSAFVNCKLNNINSTIDNLTLEKLGIAGDNGILNALKDVPLTNLGTELNNVKLGVVFGFVSQTEGNTTVWYEPCPNNCGHTSSQHITIEGETGYFAPAKGINGKMSDMTLNELATGDGMTKIVGDFTVGDLQDSKIIVINKESEYKLDILFDDTPVGSPERCSLVDYYAKKATDTTLTAQKYYNDMHKGDESHRYLWKKLTLSVFMDRLFTAL